MAGSSRGAPTRRTRIESVWLPIGVLGTGAALLHFSSTSVMAPPGHSMTMAERSGGVGGGTTTQAAVLAGERAPSVPRSRSASDQAATRYQTRFHEPAGVSVPLALAMCMPSASLVCATLQPTVDGSTVSSGGPMVSSSFAASSTRTRCRCSRRTRGPLRVAMRSCTRKTFGVTLLSSTLAASIVGAAGLGTRGTAKAYSEVDAPGHCASTCPALTPSTT